MTAREEGGRRDRRGRRRVGGCETREAQEGGDMKNESMLLNTQVLHTVHHVLIKSNNHTKLDCIQPRALLKSINTPTPALHIRQFSHTY